MKTLVIYDSVYGNTEKIAQAIGSELASQHAVTTLRASEVTPQELAGVELLVVGAPTQRFRPTPAVSNFLKSIPKDGLKGVKVAAFDTRFKMEEQNNRFLLFMVKLFGYAAEPVSEQLKKKDGKEIVAPQGFIVNDTEGPLREGELERSKSWAREIIAACSNS
jgi:flavodoxin I